MSNHQLIEKLTFHVLKEFFAKAHFDNKTLIVKRTCYQCNGDGFYYYYDPILDMEGYYECDDAHPEIMPCYHCKSGYILHKFSTLEELKNWVAQKIKHQDWTYTYSEDIEVRSREYLYQSIVQEMLWLLPEDFTKTILNQYQDNKDKNYITIGLYKTTAPINYTLCSEYYFIKIN